MSDPARYVSRGGLKLEAAIKAFDLDLHDAVCADLGASTGGFTHCMLEAGARRVYAVDTAYGVLAWPLRRDARVTVFERTNVLHFDPRGWSDFPGCDLVCLDLGWTRQALAIPAALQWLRPAETGGGVAAQRQGRIVTLIKPHYEAGAIAWANPPRATAHGRGRRRRGVLDDGEAEAVLRAVLETMAPLGVTVLGTVESPIRGGGRRGRGQGNREFLALLAPGKVERGKV